MATVYLANGQELKLAETPLADCIGKMNLRPTDYLCDTRSFPDLPQARDNLSGYRGYQHVIILVNEGEAVPPGWKAGFYRARCTPEEARQACGSI
jgi:hypothetical protein